MGCITLIIIIYLWVSGGDQCTPYPPARNWRDKFGLCKDDGAFESYSEMEWCECREKCQNVSNYNLQKVPSQSTHIDLI